MARGRVSGDDGRDTFEVRERKFLSVTELTQRNTVC
jgi:hypothetical protein